MYSGAELRAMSVPSMSKSAATATAGETSSGALDDHRDALAATDAQGGDAEARIAVGHRVQERDQHASAARPDRMAEGDGPSMHVDAVLRDAQLAQHAEGLPREGLVKLPEIDLLLAETGTRERLLRGGPR